MSSNSDTLATRLEAEIAARNGNRRGVARDMAKWRKGGDDPSKKEIERVRRNFNRWLNGGGIQAPQARELEEFFGRPSGYYAQPRKARQASLAEISRKLDLVLVHLKIQDDPAVAALSATAAATAQLRRQTGGLGETPPSVERPPARRRRSQ